MNTIFKAVIAAASLTSLAAAPALAGDCAYNKDKSTAQMSHSPDIVSVAAGNSDFGTLVAAVKAADLVGTLQGDGPFTVFAPTNAAFDALPSGTVPTLLKPENKAQLQNVLTYHVVAGEVKAADLVKAIQDNGGAFNIQTVSGGSLSAQLIDGAPYLIDENRNAAKITATDINAANGVVHVIDKVVLPSL